MINFKKVIGWGVAVLVLFCVIYLNTQHKPNEKLRFVVMAPLTGAVGYLGQEAKLGIETAYKNAPNKDDVELVFEDTQGNTSTAIGILQRHLAFGDRFFYTSTTAQTNAVLSVLDKQTDKSFVYAITMMPNQTKDYPLAYRIYPTSMQEMEIIADFVKKKNYKKIGMLTPMLATYEGTTSYLKSLLPNVQIYEEMFATDNKDFRILLEKMKRHGIEALVVNGYAPHLRSILHHKDETWRIPLLFGFNAPQLKDLPYRQLQDVIFRQPDFILDIPASQMFKNNNKITVGHDTFYAYDAMAMFMKAVAQATTKEPAEIGEKLQQMEYNGLTGKIVFDENRDAKLKMKMFRFDANKNIVPVAE